MLHFLLLFAILISLLTIANRLAKFFLLAVSSFSIKKSIHEPSISKKQHIPKVVIHVAISNEQPDVVKKTLTSLIRLDYPNYTVIVVDNNTHDKNLWIPIKDFCEENSSVLKFLHVERLKGFKAGALKYALEHTPNDVELIAIVDADNTVSSTFLVDLVSYFKNPNIAFVQTPLGFEVDPKNLPFQSWIYLIYRYFLSIYMPATNNFGCAPFIGSMGIIRRSALENAGGWDGFYLTEDMELSFRIFETGYKSVFIDHSYGFSLPPYNFTNFKKQHFRWNFGNIQIWRDHIFDLLRIRQWSEPSLMRKLAYFSCPGIYANFYYLPFVIISCLLLVLNFFRHYTKESVQISFIILFVLIIEVLGDLFFFYLLGRKEKINAATLTKNLVSWWALSLNNSLSTYSALFKPTRSFDITTKIHEEGIAKTKTLYKRNIETLIFLGIYLLLAISFLFSTRVETIHLLNITILGLMSVSTMLLPKNRKE